MSRKNASPPVKYFYIQEEGGLLDEISTPDDLTPMTSSDSVSEWLSHLKDGKQTAAQDLWNRYVDRLVRLARNKLGDFPRRLADENDIASIAFEAFLRGAATGKFTRLLDRDDLWQIMVMLTDRKIVDHMRTQRASKRGGGNIRGDSVFEECGNRAEGFDCLADPEPTPEFAYMFTERVQQLLSLLDTDELRSIAIYKMEGYTNVEIATQLGKSLSAVERKLSLIRDIITENQDVESN